MGDNLRAINSKPQLKTALFFLLLFIAAGCRTNHTGTTAKIDSLVGLMENTTEDLARRADAARELGRMKAHGATECLLAQLPGNWDILTYQVIRALGEIGDKRALPVLREMNSTPMFFPVQIRTVLPWAIERCEKSP